MYQFFGGFLKALNDVVSTLNDGSKRHFQCVRFRKNDPHIVSLHTCLMLHFSLRLVAHIHVKRALLRLIPRMVIGIPDMKLYD